MKADPKKDTGMHFLSVRQNLRTAMISSAQGARGTGCTYDGSVSTVRPPPIVVRPSCPTETPFTRIVDPGASSDDLEVGPFDLWWAALSAAEETIQGSPLAPAWLRTPGFRTLAAARRALLDPVPSGVSVGHPRVGAGTLGCLVDVPGGRCILSNNHVLAETNAGIVGDDILQPGHNDGTPTHPARRIAGLLDHEPIRFGSAPNGIDAAIACVDDSTAVLPGIMTLGLPANPPMAGYLDQTVAKHGRTTGLTFGTIVDVSFDGNVDYDGRIAYFEDQIVIVGTDGPFSEPGDSGSLIVDSPASRSVGLLFAGDGYQTVANPIRLVLNRFGATVVTA